MTQAQNRLRLRNDRLARLALVLLIPLLMGIATAMPAHAQTLHALLVIMDADPNVGSAMQVNAETVQYLLREVEKRDIGLQVETKLLLSSQNQARKGDLTAWLDTREIADEDILLVYFSGKGRFAAPTEYLYLQDGGIAHTELSKKVRGAGTGRLTLLITDRCDVVVESRHDQYLTVHPVRPATAQLENLFKQHEGFLHLTSVTAQGPGWADNDGGLFTRAMTSVIEEPKPNGIASWTEVFEYSRKIVSRSFERAYSDLPESMRETLREQGIQPQTPKAYQLPTPSKTPAPTDTDALWTLENPHATFTADLKTDKKTYVPDASIILDIEITDSTHVFIFNWNNASDFACLFPNKFEDDNFLGSGKIWSIPRSRAKYEIFAAASGTERFKILALRNAADSNAIQRMLIAAREDATQQKRDKPQDHSHQPKHTQQLEEQIVQYLQQMKPSDWAENRTTAEVKTHAPTDKLWTLENPHATFTADLKTDKKTYVIDALITLGIEVTDSTHVFIFNWKNASDFACLFPNKFEDNNFLASGKIWPIPRRGAKYEIFAEASGTERFKILALRHATDSNAIQRMLITAREDETQQRDKPQDHSHQPKHTDQQIEEQIVQYLQQMKPSDWAENRTTAEVKTHAPLEEDGFRDSDDDSGAQKDRPPEENNLRDPNDVGKVGSHRHPNPVNIVFFKEGEYGPHAYLAQLKDPDNQDAAEVEVHIFNAALREKYDETLPKAWIIRERTEPKEGWGHRSLMLSFYRDEEWIFTTDVVMYEDHYLLPERLNGKGDPIQGDREVGFGDVRIPIPVAFERDSTDGEK